MGGIVRVKPHKACSNLAIYSQDQISGLDNKSGENESYGAKTAWNLKCQQAQRLQKLPAH